MNSHSKKKQRKFMLLFIPLQHDIKYVNHVLKWYVTFHS